MPDPISWSHALPWFALAGIWGYLLGSVPTGLILGRLRASSDLRTTGSGNIGATNALRTVGFPLALGVLLGDAGKGFLATSLAALYGPDMAVCAAAAACLGHIYPVWLRFKGGKGVAVFLGILFAFHWLTALIFIFLFLIVAALTRFISLASLVGVWGVSAVLAALDEWQVMELVLFLGFLITLAHRDNIRRLLQGQESRFGKPHG